MFYVLILLVTLTGVVLAAASDWRLGVRIIAIALGAAGLVRLALPEKDAGMLAVRHRLLDVGLLLGVGLALFVLASTIPDQP